MYYVYCHTLKIDGRKYIGITSKSPEKRWLRGNGYKHCPHMWNAIQKYGWDAFDHEIIETCESLEEANALEEKYIALFNTTDRKYGFNIMTGGECGKPTGESLVKRQKHAREIGKSHTGIPRSEEVKRKISETQTGKTYGEETRQKLREAFSQPVLCIELNKIFPSMTMAAQYFGLSKCTISAVIVGRNKTAGGYHWKIV